MKFLNLSLCIFLLISCVDKTQSNVLKLYGNPNKKEALKHLLSLAEKGDKDASFLVGRMYMTGEEIQKDIQEALKWYELAAEKDQVCALNDLTFFL